jgi:hypothetical protein
MSPTRKPRPPDKGAPPEHKPSRKVALEEVMRSLQDLVSNELATEPAKQPDEPAAATPTKPRAGSKPPAITPDTPQATDADAAETEFITLESLPDPADTSPPTLDPKPQAVPKGAVPAGGLQQELPYLDVLSPVPDADPPEAAAESRVEAMAAEPPTVDNGAGSFTLDVPPTDAITGNRAPLDIAPLSKTEAAPAPAEEINWDDIPVLEEAVEMPEGSERHETDQAMDGPPATNLPPADAARRLAIQVAARLNVELRRSGQDGLNSDVITRLARMLQEALANSTPNMENTPPDKH